MLDHNGFLNECAQISSEVGLKMVAIRCIEMTDFGRFLWVALSSRAFPDDAVDRQKLGA